MYIIHIHIGIYKLCKENIPKNYFDIVYSTDPLYKIF